jgi:hypothetical protein
MGGFEKIHPTDETDLMEKYKVLLEHSEMLFKEENSLRGRLINEERTKMMKRPGTGNISTTASTETRQR